MNEEEVKKQRLRTWVAALRSGKYEQARGALHPTTDTFCCLGVACDVYASDRWIPIGRHHYFAVDEDRRENQILPLEVAHYYGIDENPAGPTCDYTLAEENDMGRMSFAQIADFLEKEYEL